MRQIGRRRFTFAAAASLATHSIGALGEAPKHAVVGFLGAGSPPSAGARPRPFATRLKELGWIEGQNLTMERRFADGNTERLPDLAADLVRRKVHVIVVPGNPEAKAAMQATRSVPVVTLYAEDPVDTGLSRSIARPDGNVTGTLWGDKSFHIRRLQLLKEAIPGLTRVASLTLESWRHRTAETEKVDAVIRKMGVTIDMYWISKPEDVTAALESIRKKKFDVMHSDMEGLIATRGVEILEFAASNKLFDDYIGAEWADRGGVMSYGPRFSDNQRRAAEIVDKILRGAKPAEIPFEYPKNYDLVINLKSAKARGITIPQSILLRADRVIE